MTYIRRIASAGLYRVCLINDSATAVPVLVAPQQTDGHIVEKQTAGGGAMN